MRFEPKREQKNGKNYKINSFSTFAKKYYESLSTKLKLKTKNITNIIINPLN